MKDRLLNAQEISTLAGCSVQTLNLWYKWKELEPDNKIAKMLPEYVRGKNSRGNTRTRYWKYSDIYKLMEFKANIPKGRNGIMGTVSSMYKKPKEKRDE